ncbi:MAG: circadian clock protein KaiC [Deltaproteobacteria bacterium]|nr:circadian clock protein KaiC [Deltaproteobacteria bacterium]MCF8118737.1 circadian clock protein KaiC [Deltaproteobacteria bacterium]
MPKTKKKNVMPFLAKSPTGIQGLDEITGGGLPRGRPTLVCGSAGSGKTLLAMEFMVHGAVQYDEPGVFVSFEENEEDLKENVASFGWDLSALSKQGKLSVEYIHIDRSEIEETGEYTLEGLFIMLQDAIDSIGAKRIAIDTLEVLFTGFTSDLIMRAEIRRLFRWLKEKGLTAVITGEPGGESMTRHGLEEYVSDCVIQLHHRIHEETATRRLRIVKYRGSSHGTNEYPFLIETGGISILPVTSIGLNYEVTTERISTGIARLDTMLGGEGYYRATSILVSGTAGTGKSSVAAGFVNAACGRGEKALYFSFEEAQEQIVRNMRSIGMNLEPWIKNGLLRFRTERATTFGLEMHLALLHKEVSDFEPQVVVIDPISNLGASVTALEIKGMLSRVIDFLKMHHITALFTDLTHGGTALEATESAVSSLMDTWILLRDIESQGERNRGLYVLKSRGMAHSNQIREFMITEDGLDLLDVYVGPGGVLTGTARIVREAEESAEEVIRKREISRRKRELERKKTLLETRIAELHEAHAADEEELQRFIDEAESRQTVFQETRKRMAQMRGRD